MNIIRPQSAQPIPENAQCIFKGKIFDIYQWEQLMYDNSIQTFEKIKRPDTVVIFGVLDDGDIILTKQEQPGKEEFIGACGGRVEEDEDILEAAKREFLEESWYQSSNYILRKAIHPASKIDRVVYFFIAKWCTKINNQTLDSWEKIELQIVSFDEFLQIGRNPKFMEKEIIPDLYEAIIDPKKYVELKTLFSPIS